MIILCSIQCEVATRSFVDFLNNKKQHFYVAFMEVSRTRGSINKSKNNSFVDTAGNSSSYVYIFSQLLVTRKIKKIFEAFFVRAQLYVSLVPCVL